MYHVKIFYVIGFLLLAVACGDRNFNPESTRVDVGGHKLNIKCLDEGSPAAILGSEFTQICSYDRAGLGESDSVEGVPTAQVASDRLHSLLSAAGINGPVVMVGYSYSGLVALLYATQHPENTAALVLVDSLQKDNLISAAEILGEQAMAVLMNAMQSNPEGVDMAASIDQVKDVTSLGDLPLTVITAEMPNLPPFIDRDIRKLLADSWLESQRALAGLSSAGIHIVAEESGHCVQCDQPKLVADSILRNVARARNR